MESLQPGNELEAAVDFLMIKNHVAIFSRRVLSMTSACRLGDSMSDSDATRSDTRLHQEVSPFVLVAHGTGGRWDVYAKAFDNPLASFDERQAACDYASDLAKTRKDSMVLIRDRERSAATLDQPDTPRTLSGFSPG
jgi:hypothetical protein